MIAVFGVQVSSQVDAAQGVLDLRIEGIPSILSRSILDAPIQETFSLTDA